MRVKNLSVESGCKFHGACRLLNWPIDKVSAGNTTAISCSSVSIRDRRWAIRTRYSVGDIRDEHVISVLVSITSVRVLCSNLSFDLVNGIDTSFIDVELRGHSNNSYHIVLIIHARMDADLFDVRLEGVLEVP